jgi:aminoglycoside phosphotransferase (APT) family kinase protein
MFEGLNEIPWADLRHAYGPADEVPMWLRQLVSSDATKRQSAISHLNGSICHQGWICPATAYAVPYLIDLLREPSTPERFDILELLVDIAAADPLDDATWRHNPYVPSWEVPEQVPFRDAHAAVAEGIPLYTALLDEAEPKVRMEAAMALCAFTERAEAHRSVLLGAFGREQDPAVRANLILALGMLAEATPAQWPFFQRLFDQHESDLSRYAAAQVLAQLEKDQAPQAVVESLGAAMLDPSQELAAFDAIPLRNGSAWSAAIWALYQVGAERLQILVAPLSERIARFGAQERGRLWFTAELLLFIVFQGKPEAGQAPRPAAELSEQQRSALVLLLGRDALWHNGNFTTAVARYGVPRKQEDLAVYLGLRTPTAPVSWLRRLLTPPRVVPHRVDQFGLYIKAMQRAYPTFRVRNYGGRVQPVGGREDDLLEVNRLDPNGAYLFRFPRTAASVARMQREIDLLVVLQGRVTLPVPNPTYSSRSQRPIGQAFMGYAKLPGKPLQKEMLASLPDDATVRAVARQLAAFLYALHHLPTGEFAPILLPLPAPQATLGALLEHARARLFPAMAETDRAALEARFAEHLDDPRRLAYTPAVVHGAFEPTNILYDAQARAIGGIIGFSEADIGDPAIDLAPLLTAPGYGEEFVRRFAEEYPDLPALLDRAQFYAVALDLDRALRAVAETRANASGLYSTHYQ